MKKTIGLIGALALLTASPQAAIIYDMDFSLAGQGTTHSGSGSFAAGSASGVNWELTWPSVSTDSTLNEFQTVGGLMRVQDWGGDGTILSDTINIVSDGSVDISGDGLVIGNDAFNVAAEGITWFYQMNSGSAVTELINDASLGSPANSGDDIGFDFTNVAVSAGDILQIGFTVNVNGVGDGVEISSYSVDFNPIPIPEPSTALLAAFSALLLFSRKRL